MTDSPDLEVQFDSRVDDGQLQHDEQISKSDIHVGQGDVTDEHEGDYVDRLMAPFSPVTCRRPPSLKPEIYDGTDDWDEYQCHFQVCAELGNWNEREKVLALSASLRGAARTFLMSLTASERQNYDLLVMKLSQRFGSLRQQNRWLARFESRKRQPGESIAALGDDLRQMAQRAYVGLGSVAQEVLALNQLYKTMTLEMKCRCIDRNCKTVSDAVDIIERFEGILGDQTLKKPNIRAVTQETTSAIRDNEIQKMFNELIERIKKLEKNKTSNDRSCFLCKQPDHFYRDCPRNRRGPNMRNDHRYLPPPQRAYQAPRYQEGSQGNGRPSSQ